MVWKFLVKIKTAKTKIKAASIIIIGNKSKYNNNKTKTTAAIITAVATVTKLFEAFRCVKFKVYPEHTSSQDKTIFFPSMWR